MTTVLVSKLPNRPNGLQPNTVCWAPSSPNHLDDVVLTTSRSQRSNVVVPSFLLVSPPRSASISPSPSKRRPRSDELDVDAAASTSTLEPVTTPRRKAKKKTQWADGGEEAQESVEIVVDDGNLAHDSDDMSDEGDESDDDNSTHGSLLYPGSPGGNPAAPEDIPEPMRRTWETFSQSYSPKKLNDIIVEQSRDAQLILINLPDHYKGMEPHRYMV